MGSDVFFYPRKGSGYGIGAHFVQYLRGLRSSLIQDPNPHETASNKGFHALMALQSCRCSAVFVAYLDLFYAYPAVAR